MRTDPGSGSHIMFPDFCQSVLLAFGQRTHISHDHHSRGQCCSSASISYDVPCMGVISYQKTFASALTNDGTASIVVARRARTASLLSHSPCAGRRQAEKETAWSETGL